MNWFGPLASLAVILAVGLAPCWAGTLAQFRTPIGDLEVELFDADKPITVQNFLRYVSSGTYSNMFLHRWVPGFVVQGGGFQVIKQSGTNVIDSIPIFGTIANEYGVNRQFGNVYGTLAMARVGGLTNSASSQWFFNLATNAFLDAVDGGFTVFGRVLRGTNILNRFNNTSVSNSIYRLQLGGALNELPVLKAQPDFQDLVYVDISVLNVQVRSIETGARSISWTSVSNAPNHLEFTTNFPPAWKTLTSTNGTGAVVTVTDSGAGASARFYRVRVDY